MFDDKDILSRIFCLSLLCIFNRTLADNRFKRQNIVYPLPATRIPYTVIRSSPARFNLSYPSCVTKYVSPQKLQFLSSRVKTVG